MKIHEFVRDLESRKQKDMIDVHDLLTTIFCLTKMHLDFCKIVKYHVNEMKKIIDEETKKNGDEK